MMNLPDYIMAMQPFLQEKWKKSQFQKLTDIQIETMPYITDGKDVIAESPTGTGKTLAYLLPLLEKIDPQERNVQVIVLGPSHELVMQLFAVIQEWTTGSGIRAASLIGGANVKRQLDRLKKKPHIVAGTPGRILELIKTRKINMHEVKTIVLDEGDQLLIAEHVKIIEQIIKATLRDRQLLLFSATVPDKLKEVATKLMNDPLFVKIKQNKDRASNVEHLYFTGEQRDKIDLLRSLITGQGMQALVFVRDIGNLDVLAQKLAYRGIKLGVLHSDSKKEAREEALRHFRTGEIDALLATDIAARGLDIEELDYVIHYDISQNLDQYIHRSGRTGRMDASGTVISLVTDREAKVLNKYSRDLNIPIQKKTLFAGRIQDEKPTTNKKRPNPKQRKRSNKKS